MSANTRTFQQQSISIEQVVARLFHGQFLLVVLLVVAVMISAFSVVYVRDMNRQVFSELQTAQATRDQLQIQWSQLLLEQSTWSTQARVQRVAETQLHMHVPRASNEVIVTE